jgi:hypothetical protein
VRGSRSRRRRHFRSSPYAALATPLSCTELLSPPRHTAPLVLPPRRAMLVGRPATSYPASPVRCGCSSTSRSWQAAHWVTSSRSCRSCPHLGTPHDIDVAMVSHFAFLYSRESMAKHAQVVAMREANASCSYLISWSWSMWGME